MTVQLSKAREDHEAKMRDLLEVFICYFDFNFRKQKCYTSYDTVTSHIQETAFWKVLVHSFFTTLK